MNTFRVGILLCCVAAIFANGCNSIDPCAGTCDPDEACVNGECVPGCITTDDCDDGEICFDGQCSSN